MDDDLEKWLAKWDQAQIEIDAERPQVAPEPQPRTSYFNDLPAENDYEDQSSEAGQDWYDLYQRSVEIDYSKDDNLLTDGVSVQYAGTEGYGKETVATKPPTGTGNKVYTQNPIHFASAGQDQGDDKDGRVRVTKNWSDGDEIRELDDVKRRVEALERKFHEADVLKKKAEKSKLQTELTNLRDRVRKLCEKLVPSAQEDLT
jgi:hypothetical protein